VKHSSLLLSSFALLCGVAGFFAYQRWTQPAALTTAPGAAAAAASSSTLAEATADAPPKLVVPEAVPDLKLKDLNGKLHALREFRGAPAIYNFWATWCCTLPSRNSAAKRATGRAWQLQIADCRHRGRFS
jgi:hypothetical protein